MKLLVSSLVNIKLAELGLHEKKDGVWTLTKAGKEYGAPFCQQPTTKVVGLHLTDVDAYGWLTAPG